MGEMTPKSDRPQIVILPPLLFGGFLALGCILTWLFPLGPGLAAGNLRALSIGLGFAVIGMALAGTAGHQMHRAGTNVVPTKPATALVASGLFGLTRNPIYIGLTVTYFGLSIALASLWALLLLPFAMLILQRGVVLREEAYLESKFGKAYLAYKRKVPRWL
jgi:protein-S-isoprenylcysteine O-methyltransferase Ste14